jgi:hypothetical protein
LVRIKGNGEIEPSENGTDIRLREVIIDGGYIIASGLEIHQRIELWGAAVLIPAFGEIVDLSDGIELVIVANKTEIPRLEIGNVGNYSVVPSGVRIDVNELELGVVGINGKAIIVAETLNCEDWKAKAILSDSERFELECLTSGNVVSFVLREVRERSPSKELPDVTVAILNSRSQTPQPEEGDPKLFLGLTQKELIIAGVVIVVAIVLIAGVIRCCKKKKNKNDMSEKEVEFLRKGRHGDDIYT